VAINTWWDDDPGQRYWMQITDRDDLDGPLLSPKLPHLTWGYDLVSQVQPGDHVLHWWTGGAARGLVGWSEVEEPATVIPEYTWTPHHGHGEERTTLGWCTVLGQLRAFAAPVTSVQLLPVLDQIVAVDQALGAQHRGPIYFPITRYGADRPVGQQEVRAAQAYFVKFPVELFDVIPGIGSARIDTPLDPIEADLPEDFQPPGKKAPVGRTTRARDPKLRDAVERRSLDVAKAYYLNELRGTDYEEVGKPYDIRVMVQGMARRCEVKGSSMEIGTVELTTNEVEHGKAYTPIDLIVVDNIVPTKDPATGEVTGATGGRRRVWMDWKPVQSDLKAITYAYTLPGGAII
jgi:hypothetical protein